MSDTGIYTNLIAITTDFVNKSWKGSAIKYGKCTLEDVKLSTLESSNQPTSSSIHIPSHKLTPMLYCHVHFSSKFTEHELKLGAYYDPHLLHDYGGPCFSHRNAQLKRLCVRNKASDLVPPWKLCEVLKPGTLILANVSLHCCVY